MRRETSILEFKETVTDTFLKTVCAYANYGTGQIIFGVRDDGKAVGLPDLSKAEIQIENRINDSIDPVPDYEIEVDEDQRLIVLTVQKGLFPPYMYKGQVYIRHNTSSLPADRAAVMSLIMQDKNLSWDELPSRTKTQIFTFDSLAAIFTKKTGLRDFDKGSLITLDLYNNSFGYTNAGWLFSDQNGLPGVDIVRFGESQNEILYRAAIEKRSLIDIFYDTVHAFEMFYMKEVISGLERVKTELIPASAFREALANALVHRDWSARSVPVQIAMMPDKIEIVSPGGLPDGMEVDQYFRDFYSVPRNPHVAYIFLRLGLIERFGTGIRRIRNAYLNEVMKPVFDIGSSTIRIVLPVSGNMGNLTKDQQHIYSYLRLNGPKSRADIEEACHFSRSKTTNLLNLLMSMQVIGKTGRSRSTRYFVL